MDLSKCKNHTMTGDFDAGEAEYHISAEATPGTSGQSGPDPEVRYTIILYL